jgi:TatD DNase family protein
MLYPEPDSFINIHSHHKPKLDHEFVIRNAYMRLTAEQIEALNYPVSAGLHPWHLNRMKVNECMDQLIELATLPNVLAIGEIGIDKAIDTPLLKQIEYFDAQFTVAKAVQKPLIIHAVRSYTDFVPFLKKTKLPFIFHQFQGNEQQAKELLKYDVKLSFGKNLFEPKSSEVFAKLPNDAFLLETDTAHAIHIGDIYTKAAELKGLEVDELKSIVFTNSSRTIIHRP